jgi:hypothetical protein
MHLQCWDVFVKKDEKNISSEIKQVTELVEAAAEGSKLTKADSGFN